MNEFDIAERVVRDRALPPCPALLARGQSWPVAWHQSARFAAVLFVQHSSRTPRWRRPRFDLLVAELAAEDAGPFVCATVGGMGPGSRDVPFGPAPAMAAGVLDGGTAERTTTADEEGQPTSRHALGWGRAGSETTAVELRTDIESVRVPVVSHAGYFMVIAIGGDPSLVIQTAP